MIKAWLYEVGTIFGGIIGVATFSFRTKPSRQSPDMFNWLYIPRLNLPPSQVPARILPGKPGQSLDCAGSAYSRRCASWHFC